MLDPKLSDADIKEQEEQKKYLFNLLNVNVSLEGKN